MSAHRAAEDVAGQVKTTLYTGAAKVQELTFSGGDKGERIVVDGAIAGDVNGLEIKEGSNKQSFPVWSKDDDTPSAGKTSLYIHALDYQSDFVPGTGLTGGPGQGGAYDRTDNYFPRHVFAEPARTWTPGGLGFQEDVDIEVFARGPETAGISPENTHGGKEYFAGRTIVFTGHPAFRRTGSFDTQMALTVIVHELGHAFGFPHKCGYHTWETGDTSCAMNYTITWLYTPGTRTVRRFTPGTEGQHMCARHLHGIRRVHLEDNPAMWTWP